MKNIRALFPIFGLAAFSCLPVTRLSAQTILPETTVPVIVTPYEQEISYQERILCFDIAANIPFEISDEVDWVQTRKGKDGTIYIHIARNTEFKTRETDITFFNTEKGVKEVMHLIQGPDYTISAQDYDFLMSKFRNGKMKNPSTKDIEEALKLYSPNGSFTDVNYQDHSRTMWDPMKHINRLEIFVHAYVNPKNPYYGNAELYQKIVKGLQYWYAVNPQCNNWWYNMIGEPKPLGLMLVMMRAGKQQIPADLEKKTLDRMAKEGGNPKDWTGANRSDIAMHWMYRACLTQNEKDLKYALNQLFDPIRYTTSEGFQHDKSYFQHGNQLYIVGYGDAIVSATSEIAEYVAGTKFQLEQRKVAILRDFLLEAYYKTIRGQYTSFDVLGRGVTRPNATRKSGSTHFAKRMINIDPEHKAEYQKVINRIEGKSAADNIQEPSHTHFFRGDYTLHIRPEYTFDVRMVSSRTVRTECGLGNGENLKGHYLSEGTTNIRTKGDEYFNIFPVWDWTKIPGTTAPNFVTKPNSSYIVKGSSSFCGGVSDSIYGASGYTYYDNYDKVNTGGNKSWFFFDKEVVCLGNIRSTATQTVNTTVNQCFKYQSDILLNDGKQTTRVKAGQYKDVKPQWVLHNHVGYVFPEGGNVWLNNQVQKGNWYDINTNYSKEMIQDSIFSLGFDHGIKPKDVSYAYIVVPTVSTEKEMTEYQAKKSIKIVSNTKDIQSVYNNELKLWQTVFFQAGTIEHNGLSIKVSQPCAVMLKPVANGHYQLHVADPAQRQNTILITVTTPQKAVKTIRADFAKTGIYAGLTKAYTIK